VAVIESFCCNANLPRLVRICDPYPKHSFIKA
jgi:hypothetical protein